MRYSFDKYVLDTDRRELRRGEQLILVEPQVFDVLVHLVSNRDRVVSRDDLFTAVWEGRIVSESTLTTRINAVRQAVGDSGEQQRLVKTLPRKGFRFVGVVHEEGGVTVASSAHLRIPSMALPDRPSIAVLPFANMSGDPDQAYFADGMAEEIINSARKPGSLRANGLAFAEYMGELGAMGTHTDMLASRPSVRRWRRSSTG